MNKIKTKKKLRKSKINPNKNLQYRYRKTNLLSPRLKLINKLRRLYQIIIRNNILMNRIVRRNEVIIQNKN